MSQAFKVADLPEGFRENILVTTGGCWEWKGRRYSSGYGRYYWPKADGGDKKHHLAHRFSYESLVGPIEQVINHKCNNKPCVNPAHLEDVSQRENVRYSLSDTCPAGHDITRGHPNTWVDPKTNKRKCRACMREKKRTEYQVDPQAGAAASREKYWKSPDEHRRRARESYYRNREAILAKKKEQYRMSKEKKMSHITAPKGGDIGETEEQEEIEVIPATQPNEVPVEPSPQPEKEPQPA